MAHGAACRITNLIRQPMHQWVTRLGTAVDAAPTPRNRHRAACVVLDAGVWRDLRDLQTLDTPTKISAGTFKAA